MNKAWILPGVKFSLLKRSLSKSQTQSAAKVWWTFYVLRLKATAVVTTSTFCGSTRTRPEWPAKLAHNILFEERKRMCCDGIHAHSTWNLVNLHWGSKQVISFAEFQKLSPCGHFQFGWVLPSYWLGETSMVLEYTPVHPANLLTRA